MLPRLVRFLFQGECDGNGSVSQLFLQTGGIVDSGKSGLAFSEWLTMFENQTMVAAMIDRLTYRSFVLNMNSSKPYRAEYAAQSSSPA